MTDTDDRRLDVLDVDRRDAIDFPNGGWAPSARLENLDAFPQPSQHVAFRTDPFIRMGPYGTYDRERRRDPASRALVAANAVRVDPSAWLILNDDGATATPMAGRDFVVNELPKRNARQRPNVKCQRGVR